MGITITNEDPPVTCVYDRRLDFECDVIRLPHASSALATHTASAVVCGKLCRAWGLSSSRAAFAEQACIATLTHTGRNGTLSSIKKAWGLFLRRLLPDFVLDKRLVAIKECCIALASLPSESQEVSLKLLTGKARTRQKAATAETRLPVASLPLPSFLPANVLPKPSELPVPSYNPAKLLSPSVSSLTKKAYGITNLGNTCYLSVTLHLASSLKARVPDAINIRACSAVLETRRGKTNGPFLPTEGLLRSFAPSGQDPHQQQCAIQCFESFLERHVNSLYTSLKLHQECTCSCGEHSYRSVLINVLHLNPTLTVDDTLDLERAISAGCVDDTLVCLNCECGSTVQNRSYRVDDTGPFLVVSIKRAQRDGRSNTAVYTPLVVTCFRGLSYSLIAVVIHSGQDAGSGHYTCLLDEKGWLYCDDSNIIRVVDIVKSLESHERGVTLWLYARLDSNELGPNTRSLSSNSSMCPAPLSPSRVSSSAPFASTRARVRTAQLLMAKASLPTTTTTSR